MYRAYNATRQAHGGPFHTPVEATDWAIENLPEDIPPINLSEITTALESDGRAMVSESQSKTFAEDVVIYDPGKHPPDKDGYIDW